MYRRLDHRKALQHLLSVGKACHSLPLYSVNITTAKTITTTTKTTTTVSARDILDRYRVQGPLSEELWEEIRNERQAALRQISPQLYKQVYQEIWQAQQRNHPKNAMIDEGNNGSDMDNLPAVGCAGRFAYEWITSRPSVDPQHSQARVFRRVQQGATGEGSFPPSNIQILFELKPGQSLRTPPSLSADERFAAYVLQSATSSSTTSPPPTGSGIILQNMETQHQQKVFWKEFFDMERIVQVEFGASYKDPKDPHGHHRIRYEIFLLQANEEGRPCQIWRTSFVSEQNGVFSQNWSSPLELVWSVENDPTLYLLVQRTKGGEYVGIQAQSLDSNEVYLVGPKGETHHVAPRQAGRFCHVDVGTEGDVFVLVQDAEEGHGLIVTQIKDLPLVKTLSTTTKMNYSPTEYFVATGYEIMEVDLYRYWVVLYEVNTLNGTPRIRVVDRRTAGDEWVVHLPHTVVAHLRPVHNAWYDATSFRFQVDSPIRPAQVYQANFISRRVENLTRQSTVDHEHALEDQDYEMHRVAVSSGPEGTMVPLSIIRRRTATPRARTPVILTAYGAYGENVDLSFNPAWRPLLDRGYCIAFAHIRGGGERGISWHAQGRRIHKPRGAQDYLACAQALHQYLLGSSPIRLIAKAFSAGGIAVAGAVNQKPNLFETLVLSNAFLDVYATLTTPVLPLTEHEWDEYGNPLENQRIKEVMRSYCPVLTAPREHSRPRVLLTAGLLDEVVPFWNALVYARALRNNPTNHEDHISVIVEDGVGHDFGMKLMHIAAVEVAFILSNDKQE